MVKIYKSVSARIVIVSLLLTFAICEIDNNGYTLEKEYVETQIPEVIEDQAVQPDVITPSPTITVKKPMVRPLLPNATPATVETKPAVSPVATPATVETKPAVSPVATPATVVTKPAVSPVATKSGPSCRAGFYWEWNNPQIKSGKCVKDYENNCDEYDFDHGKCNKCFPGFIKTKTQYGDDFCLKEGATMPDLDTLRKGNKAYNKLHRDSSMTWFIWLLIIVVMIIVIGVITRCICNRRNKNIEEKGGKFKDLDSAEFYNMGEPNSPF